MWSESDESDVEDVLLLMAAAASAKEKRKRVWVHPINKKRKTDGEYYTLFRGLEADEQKFYGYFRMTTDSFRELHGILASSISRLDTNWREAISSKERLAICLRYLATGDSFKTIAFSFRLGHSTVARIVKEVCQEVWNSLQPIYMPTPTEDTWRRSESGFRELWKFPNCLGSADGKHVAIKCPKNSGSNFYCYKNFFSIVLLAIVDPFYQFVMVDIGSCGRFSDNGILESSSFYKECLEGKTLLPPKPLPGTQELVPQVLIGDEGFGLKPYLMRPYTQRAAVQDPSKRNFNKRLSTARRVVENAFGILAEKWRVFHKPMACSVSTAEAVVKATCCLHNFLRAKEGRMAIVRVPENSALSAFATNTPPNNQRPLVEAFEVREKFRRYFEMH